MLKPITMYSALAAGIVLLGGMLAGCTKPEVETPASPSAELSVTSVGVTEAVLNLKTSLISEYAWAVYAEEPGTAPVPDVLFATGTVAACADGDNEFTVSGLEGNTGYTVYLAAKTVDDEFYDEVLAVNFTTTDYTEVLTILDAGYDSFRAHIQIPEDVIANGHAIRYVPVDIFTYNMNKQGMWGVNSDASMMQSNGGPDFCVTESSTLTFDNSEEQLYLHENFVPGAQLVFMIGEYEWGETWGNEGYLLPLFDEEGFMMDSMENPDVDEASYWSGVYDKVVVQLRKPELLEPTVNVEMDIKATSGTIKLTPEDGVVQYTVFCMPEELYQMVLGYLDNNEDHLQWFSTTVQAYMNGALSLSGAQEIDIADLFYDVPAESHYHLLVTAMGDAKGYTQNFQHIEFDTKAKVLEAPAVTVTPVGGEVSEDPFKVVFNVKNTGNVPVVSGYYAANYEREWESALSYSEYADIISTGNPLSAAEIELINSPEGYDMTFNSIDGMTTRLGILVYNEENTPNVVEEGGPAIAEQSTPYQPADERVESALFTDLPGDWTMTAEVSNYDYNQGSYVSLGAQSIKVSIYDGLNDYPDVLPENVYSLYPDMSKAEVDNLYEEFKMEAEAFNAKVRGQNWLLCVGFGYETPSEYYSMFDAATPYELFCDPEYSGYDVASLFYDFGPKWYLEVAADGSVTVPMDKDFMYPLSAWNRSTYYMAGYDKDNTATFVSGSFPAEVSSGHETITVNALTSDLYEGVNFYPNAIVDYGYYQSLSGYRIDGPLTLTKGWNGSDNALTSASVKSAGEAGVPVNNVVGFVPGSAPKSRTAFPAESEIVKYEQVENFKVVTPEEFLENVKTYSQQLLGR